MESRKSAVALCTALVTACSLAHAQAPSSTTNDLGPTRGFTQEWAQTTSYNKASVDLESGDLGTGGGVRLGLKNSELIINSASVGEANVSQAVFKLGLGNSQSGSFNFDLAPIVAFSYFDNDAFDAMYLSAGAAITGRADDLILNLQPALAYVDDGEDSDVALELGLGAYYALPETEFGRFMPGIEFSYSSADNVDSVLSLGVRWVYNPRVVVDLVLIQNGDEDIISLPGLVRLNLAF